MASMTITGADAIRLDERTDVREIVVRDCPTEDCEELTRQLEAGEAELLPGELRGWGRERTLRDTYGGYYHVDVEVE